MIEKGNKVKITYEGRLESGEVFDSSERHDGKPLEFEVGSGMVIKGFDEAVIGMKKGEEKEFSIESKDAYGEIREDLKKEVPKDLLPKGQEPKAGMMLIVQTPQGQQMPVKIEKVEGDSVVIDFNHPLAGKKLIFKIKIVGVENNSI
jgi:FKBP-type peptidyl-prolyl cis-trans isomerase 2